MLSVTRPVRPVSRSEHARARRLLSFRWGRAARPGCRALRRAAWAVRDPAPRALARRARTASMWRSCLAMPRLWTTSSPWTKRASGTTSTIDRSVAGGIATAESEQPDAGGEWVRAVPATGPPASSSPSSPVAPRHYAALLFSRLSTLAVRPANVESGAAAPAADPSGRASPRPMPVRRSSSTRRS